MPGGGGAVATEDKLVEIQIQLARMEKTLEAVPTLTITIETTRDLARRLCNLRNRRITGWIALRMASDGCGALLGDQLSLLSLLQS